jgi:hypothetical protein
MTLPNYFIADLPPDTELGETVIREACQTLRRNRDRYLATRSTQSVINLLSGVAAEWLEPAYPFRKLALEQGPAATGFSQPTLAEGLDTFFRAITRERLQALLEQDLGQLQRLDALAASAPEEKSGRASVATAPALLAHVTAGNLPCPAFSSMVLGLLLRSAQFVKCASGSAFLPRLFAHSLYEADHKLGACLEVAEWRGGRADLETVLFEEADCVTATGSDEALSAIRQFVPRKTRFVGYGSRVSFAFVSSRSLTGLNAAKVVARAACDVTAWNQLGCLSPHVIYVESGGALSPAVFAADLAEELQRREGVEPRGELPVVVAGGIASRRSIYEMRAAHSEETRLWCSPKSTAWTVVFEADPRFQLSCLHRFIYVKSVRDLTEALQGADMVREHVSTVGLAAPEDQAEEIATTLARWGASRVCPLGRMQDPPLLWRHDGQPALAALVRWTDWET